MLKETVLNALRVLSCNTDKSNEEKTFHNLCATSKVPNKHLNRDELEKKLGSEKNAVKNAKSREKYWKNKCSEFENECLEVDERDHKDFGAMLQNVDCSKVSEEMKLLIEEQIRFSNTPSKGYRWHPK